MLAKKLFKSFYWKLAATTAAKNEYHRLNKSLDKAFEQEVSWEVWKFAKKKTKNTSLNWCNKDFSLQSLRWCRSEPQTRHTTINDFYVIIALLPLSVPDMSTEINSINVVAFSPLPGLHWIQGAFKVIFQTVFMYTPSFEWNSSLMKCSSQLQVDFRPKNWSRLALTSRSVKNNRITTKFFSNFNHKKLRSQNVGQFL